ncbi:MAG: hypothetical protein VCA55_05625 [Verrucomicrobiales bacterium]
MPIPSRKSWPERDSFAALYFRLPSSGSDLPPRPAFKPKAVVAKRPATKGDAEAWKDKYFEGHPEADANEDGKLAGPEYKAHKAGLDALQSTGRKPKIKS